MTEATETTLTNRLSAATANGEATPATTISAGTMRPFNERTLSYTDFKDLAKVMAMSSFFKDADDGPKAFAKMLVGRDLGIPITRALIDVQIIQGKPALAANLIAALIKRSGKYKYKILAHTNEECSIDFSEKIDGAWESCGPPSTFTMKDAQQAGLTSNPTWKKFPKNMLFSRAISNGAKQYCGDICLGSVYTPDELDPNIVMDGDGNIITPTDALRRAAAPARPAAKVEVVERTTTEEVSPSDAAAPDETVASLARDVEDLANAADFNLKEFLKKSKVTRLESLDADSLRNVRNVLQLRLESKS